MDASVESEKRPTSEQLEVREVSIVKWDGDDDEENVRNVSKFTKWAWSLILITAGAELTALSSVWGNANSYIAVYYHSYETVTELGLSLYVLGLALGPLISAPLSEFYGRKPVYIGGMGVFFAFQFMTAFAPNVYVAVFGRLLTSIGGSVFMSNVPGTVADLFEPREIALPISIFSLGPFCGPGVGSVISGFVIQHCGFKWVFYLFLIWSFVQAVAVCLLVPETYPPILLVKKAQRLRRETGNEALRAPLESEPRSLTHAFRHHCLTPVKLLIFEPMVLLLCLYNGYLLSVIYLFFVAYPLVFKEVYHFDIQFVGLSYVGISLGMVVAAALTFAWNRLYCYQVKAAGGIAKPEFRLPQVILGATLMPIGIFGFGWTVYPRVNFMVPIVLASFFGMGSYQVGNGIQAYLVEAYHLYAASATGACCFVRAAMASGSPLYGTPLLNNLGFHWGISLLGFLAVVFLPCPIAFYIYGERIRKQSRFAYARR